MENIKNIKNIKWISGNAGIEAGHPRKLTAVVFCQDCGYPVALGDGLVSDEKFIPDAGSSLTCEEVRELENLGDFSLYANTWERIQEQDCKWFCSNCSGYNVPAPIKPCEKCGEYSRSEKRQTRILPDIYADLVKRQGKEKTLVKQGDGSWKEKAVVVCGCGCQNEDLTYLEVKKGENKKSKSERKVELIVTRHPALVEYLIEKGIADGDTEVVSHASPENVRGRNVAGVLPHSLSCLTESFTEIPLMIPAEKRGKELTLDDMREFAKPAATYIVQRQE